MINFKEYKKHEYKVTGKREKYDNTIYTFDIETTSFLVLDGYIHSSIDYKDFDEKEQENVISMATMYIWMLSVNDTVYYGRSWDEFLDFIKTLDSNDPNITKIIYVHNLAFEFQFLKGVLEFDKVLARKARKPFKAKLKDFNIEFRCSYLMSNCSLEKLADVYNLPVKKQVGSLDYTKLRHSKTLLTEQELKYCEYDCLVVYEYIKVELKTYLYLQKIPLTSTGHVRRELKEKITKDYHYKRLVKKASNINPHVYNMLIKSFMGGYTHANYTFTGDIIDNVESYDFTSSYPYVLVSEKYPATEFKRCKVEKIEDIFENFAYLLHVKFYNVKSKYYNNFISSSKCLKIKNAEYDNGRLYKAEEIEIILTDVDFKFLIKAYKIGKIEFIESYKSIYDYLPKLYINFILDKYVLKTQYKNVEGKEIEYQLEKGKFNALYGMCVTNNIKDKVDFINGVWSETPLTNEEIIEALLEERKKCFLEFSWGVWCTAWARKNLLENVIKLDKDVIYCDTDSIKLTKYANLKVIEDYNKTVIEKITRVSDMLNIDISKYKPKDKDGIEHLLGVFDHDASYKKFITLGAKKYAFIKKNKKTGNDEIGITVAGVPKKAKEALKRLEDFTDDYLFRYEDTGKMLIDYNDDQQPIELTDYNGIKYLVTDKTSACLLPTTYKLGIAEEYVEFISDHSSNRAIYKEE